MVLHALQVAMQSMIPSDLAERLSELVGLRDILVHLYWRVDLERVFKILHKGTDPLGEFLRVSKKIIKGS